MKRIFTVVLLAAFAASTAFAQEFRPIPNPPVSRTMAQTLKSAGGFSTFLALLEQAGPKTLGLVPSGGKISPVQAGPGSGPRYLTVFAPTDAAFAALPPDQLQRMMADKPGLQKLMTHHIINARVDSSKIKGAKGPVPSVAGDKIELDGTGEVLKADNADIIQPDVMATNGILQVVDQVMTPGAASPPMAAAPASATT